jgi:hypothetical protein
MAGGREEEIGLCEYPLDPDRVAADVGAVGGVDERGVAEVVVALKARVRDGCHKFGIFEAKTIAAMNVQTTAAIPAGTVQIFHGGTARGATRFRLWRVTTAPALSRRASRMWRACLNDSRASGRFPSQSAFVPI